MIPAESPAFAGRTSGRPRVVIDLATLHPGQGGAGGGIWSYARHLVQELDALAPDDVELVCLAHRTLPLATRTVRVVRVDVDTRSIAGRLAWVHATLPAWCLRHGAGVLHKLATEIPAALPRTRIVATVQDFMAEFYLAGGLAGQARSARARRGYFAAMTRRCFARADRVITSSEAVAAEARARFPRAAGHVVVVPHGVEHGVARGVEHGASPPPGEAAGVAARLLFVGMFAPHKGQLHAVRALERLAARAPAVAARATLSFRGFAEDAAYHGAVRQAAAASTVAERIRFVGYAPDVDAHGIYAGADVLLFLSEYEGFGLPLLEAQAAGVAVVCSDIPVFREVAGDGACFVPPADADAVAAALERVATDAPFRRSLVERGRANARRFGWARTARETLAVYRTLLPRR